MARAVTKVTTMKKWKVTVFFPGLPGKAEYEAHVSATNIGRACGEAIKFLRKSGLKRRKLTMATFNVQAVGATDVEF